MDKPSSLLLCIETSTSVCSVCICSATKILAIRESVDKFDHAAKLTVYIQEVMEECGINPTELKGISLSMGPGSYTGLRIGTAVAKAICFGIDIPLITIDSCKILANTHNDTVDISLGVIDARRKDLYICIKDVQNNQFHNTTFETLNDKLFESFDGKRISIAGDAYEKVSCFLSNLKIPHEVYTTKSSAAYQLKLAVENYQKKIFTNFRNFTPHYIKSANITK